MRAPDLLMEIMPGVLTDFAIKNFPDRLRLKIAYGHLLECMGNTHQHWGKPGQQAWWASVFRDGRRHCDCFHVLTWGWGSLTAWNSPFALNC